jgi:hypothetical protein
MTSVAWVGPTLYSASITGGGGAAPSTLRTLNIATGVSTVVGLTGFGAISGLAYRYFNNDYVFA